MKKGVNWIKQAKLSFDRRKEKNLMPNKAPPHQEPTISLVDRLKKVIKRENVDLVKEILDNLWRRNVIDDGPIREAQEFLRKMSQQKPETLSN